MRTYRIPINRAKRIQFEQSQEEIVEKQATQLVDILCQRRLVDKFLQVFETRTQAQFLTEVFDDGGEYLYEEIIEPLDEIALLYRYPIEYQCRYNEVIKSVKEQLMN